LSYLKANQGSLMKKFHFTKKVERHKNEWTESFNREWKLSSPFKTIARHDPKIAIFLDLENFLIGLKWILEAQQERDNFQRIVTLHLLDVLSIMYRINWKTKFMGYFILSLDAEIEFYV
jgi:hypothetical protein